MSELANNAKSVEGKWYPFSGQYKITEVTPDENSKQKAYRITTTFPSDVRKGIYPKEFAIQGSAEEDSWACYYYGMNEKEVPKEMRKMVRRIRELQRFNRCLQIRNWKLEHHFTKTIYDEEQDQKSRDGYNIADCEFCGDKIDTKKDIEGRDFCYIGDGDRAHMDCAIKEFQYICTECGTLWAENEDGSCPDCEAKLRNLKKGEAEKSLVYDAVQHYAPKELRGTFKVVYVKPQKSKHHPSYYSGAD